MTKILHRLRGVHLDEPSSPLPQRWLANDLDDVVLQLSNPLHHVTKVPKTSITSTSTSARTMTAGGTQTSSYSLSSQASTASSHHSSRTHSTGDCRCGGGGGAGFGSGIASGMLGRNSRSSVDGAGGSKSSGIGVGGGSGSRSSVEDSSASLESSKSRNWMNSKGRSSVDAAGTILDGPRTRSGVGSSARPGVFGSGGRSTVGAGRSSSVEVVTEKEDRHLERDLHEKCRIHSTSSTISKSSSSVASTSEKQRYVHTWKDIKTEVKPTDTDMKSKNVPRWEDAKTDITTFNPRAHAATVAVHSTGGRMYRGVKTISSGPWQRQGLSETLRNHRSLETDDPSSCTDYSSMVSNDDEASIISKSSTISSLCSNLDLDEGCSDVNICVKKSATTTVLNERVSFDCDSTPEISDNDASEGNRSHKDVGSEEVGVLKKAKEPKKRRFGKKMLPRPLRRSQSAGCAKDVPAHALFLQHSIGDKGIDTLEERLGRSVHSPAHEEEAEEEDWGKARRPPPPHARPIHKTASADAAMMARDEYGNVNAQGKSKRSLAKTMKKKLMFLRRRHTDTTLGSVLKGDGKQVTKIHPEEALQWSRSFESLLTDKAGLELFRGFLRSEFSDENLEFWIACEDFKAVKSSKVPAVAQKIFTDFVAAQAPREINLDAKTRVKTLSNLDHPSKEIFEEAQRKVQALMEKDSYPRFLESDVYQRIIRSQKS